MNNLLRKKDINFLHADHESEHGGMKKVLRVRDLTFMGVAAVIGAGIFSTIGTAGVLILIICSKPYIFIYPSGSPLAIKQLKKHIPKRFCREKMSASWLTLRLLLLLVFIS